MIDVSQLGALSVSEKRELLKGLLSLQTGGTGNAIPLSYGQQSLWFLHQLAPASPAYNFLYLARISTAIDLVNFQRASEALLRRHPALRSRFVVRDQKPVQETDDTASIDIPVRDATGWDDAALIAACRERADVPFDLAQAPCLRMELFRRGPTEWALLLVFHHIIADLWSADLLLQELRAIYARRCAGQEANLPLPTAQPADFVRWELVHTHGPRGLQSKVYWHTLLAGELPTLALPTDRPRPAVQTANGMAFSWPLSPASVQGVRRLAQSHATTPFVLLLAVFEVLLHKLTGQDDVLVGAVVATRAKSEWERVVGYFLNQIVFRARFAAERTFEAFAQEVREQLHQAIEHQAYPFGLLVKQLHPKRDPSRSPIFQSMFIWDKPRDLFTADAVGDGPELRLEPMLMEQRGAQFDLTLIVFELGDTLVASFRYNTDLFDATVIERWAGYFDTLLATLLREPTTMLSEASLLSPAELEQTLVAWNRTTAPYPRACFHQRFEQQARATPDLPALAYRPDELHGPVLTYAQVDRRANQLARHLRDRGIGIGATVAISLPRGLDVILAVLGTWKAGAVYLFLDPTHPPKRRAALIAEARPTLLIAAAPDTDSALPTVALPAAWPSLATLADDALDVAVTPEDRAYIIYTSGSTGQPKGVVLRHGGLCNLATFQQQTFGLGPGDRVLQFAPLSFDASVYEITLALGCGATLVLANQPALLPGRPLWSLLRDENITCIVLPPSVLALLPVEPLPALATIQVAGEACPAGLVHTWWSTGRRMFNAYGPTEMTVCATVGLCVDDGRAPSIGRPIANTRAYVLDRSLQPVPVGVAGELYLAGPGIALGYLEKPDLTVERFLPNPFDAADGGVMYQTGDLACWNAESTLDFLGRVDQQVKIRGHRIEPGEVVAVLKRHAGVQDAVVVPRHEPGQGPMLAAYVIPKPGNDCAPASIRAFLREQLPQYMVPDAVIAMDSLPLTAHGKLDRDRLPAPSGAEANPGAKGAPRTARERLLTQIWARVLHIDQVGIHDHFFDLGGASLQTLEVVQLASEQGLTLKPEMLFRYQTVAELAAACDDAASAELQAPRAAKLHFDVPQAAPTPPIAAPEVANARSRIESLGAYLPANAVSTEKILQGCRTKIDFPMERLTGIRNRRVAGEGEFSFELAEHAVAECLRRSAYHAQDVDLVICCNISRCDGPMHRFALEPTFAARVVRRFGLVNAVAFDLTNACAGTFTAIMTADALLRQGVIRRALIVSGEYITHLTTSAQEQIKSFMDPRLACLTLGDSGVALLLDRATQPEIGFQAIELYTLGKYHELCVAKLPDDGGAAPIMLTDPVNSTAITLRQAVSHSVEVLRRKQWSFDAIDALIVHQTSATTLDGAMREINRVVGKNVCHTGNMVYNVAERGNTATNTHFLAIWERILAGALHTGDRAVFAVSGSGQTVGTALYVFDDLPERLRQSSLPYTNGHTTNGHTPITQEAQPVLHFRCERRVRVEGIGVAAEAADTLAMLAQAGEECLRESARPRDEIDLVLHTGVYRSAFLAEPAVAAIAAGMLGINHEEQRTTGRRTLAFDILNGGSGTLTACFLVTELIAARAFSRGLVLAAETEHNRAYWPERPLGLVETASALVLEESADDEGFVAFGCRIFPELIGAFASYAAARNNRPAVFHERNPRFETQVTDGMIRTARAFLAREAIAPDTLTLVVPPQRPGDEGPHIAEGLGIDPARLLTLAPAGDYFTSGLALAIRQIRQQKLATTGDRVLFIEVAAGVQVWCALYQF